MEEIVDLINSNYNNVKETLLNLSIAGSVNFYITNVSNTQIIFSTNNDCLIDELQFVSDFNTISITSENKKTKSYKNILFFIENTEFNSVKTNIYVEIKDECFENIVVFERIKAFKSLISSCLQPSLQKETELASKPDEESSFLSKYEEDIINDFVLPIFVKDCNGKYLIVNNKFKQIADKEDIIGENDVSLFGEHLADIYTKNDKIILKQNKPILFEEPYIYKNENRFALVLKYPLYHNDKRIKGIGGVVIDITQQKEVEEKLKQREMLLSAFIDNLPFDIWVLNKQHEFVFQNNQSKNSVGNMLGEKYSILQNKVNKKDYNIWNNNNKLALSGYTVKNEFETIQNNKKKYYYSVLSPVYKDNSEDIELIIGVNIDWTDKKNTENALNDALNNIEKKVEERTLELNETNEKLIIQEKLLHEQLYSLGEAYSEIENMRKASENQAFFFQQILDSIDFPISVTDLNKNWTFVNKSTEKFIGALKNDLLGHKCNIWGDCNFNKENCGVERLKNGQNSFVSFVNDRYYRINTFFIKNTIDEKIGHVEFIIDVTEQKNAEIFRMDSENKFKTAFELSPIANVIIDKNTRTIVDANQSFSNLIHRYKLELLGNSIYDFLHFSSNLDLENFNKSFEKKILNNEEITFILEDQIMITSLISSGFIELKNKEHILIAINNINERKLLENNLLASKTSFENVFNNVFDALFIHEENGLIIDFNQRAVEMFKIKKNNDKQLSILEDFSTANNQGIVEGLWKLIISGKNQLIEWKVKRPVDGVEFWTELYLQKIKYLDKNVVIASVRDISERKKMELILKESEEKFKHSVASIQDALIIINNDIKISYWNPAAEKITGFKSSEVISKPLKFLLKFLKNESLQNELKEVFYNLKNNNIYKEVETEIITKDDKTIAVEICISTFKIRKTKNFVAVVKDLSKYKQAEDEINKSLQKEKELNFLKSGFISTVSHEFRTPLSGIISNVYMLEKYEEKLDQAQKNKCFERIHYAASCISLMIDDITLMHKDQSGKLEFKPQMINIEEFCEKLVTETFANYGLGREIRISIQSNYGEAFIDTNLLKHIIVNLITNAIKYSNNEKWIEFTILEDLNENVKIIIKDYGIGISEEEQKYIFEPFYRGKNVNVVQGTGLGLSIVKRCVELHKGKIKIISEIGVGTEVIINIPIINKFI